MKIISQQCFFLIYFAIVLFYSHTGLRASNVDAPRVTTLDVAKSLTSLKAAYAVSPNTAIDPANKLLDALGAAKQVSLEDITKVFSYVSSLDDRLDPDTSVYILGLPKRATALAINSLYTSTHDEDTSRICFALIAKFLARVQNESISHFQPYEVVENVSPPPGVQGASGMDPATIEDPLKRAQYIKDILINNSHALENRRQTIIQEILDMNVSSLYQYVDIVAKTSPEQKESCNAALLKFGLQRNN